MNSKLLRLLPALAALAVWAVSTPTQATPLRTGFDYQGRLSSGAGLASGLFEFRFTLFDVAAQGNPVAGPVTNSNVIVTNGLFHTVIDFGAKVYDGTQYWIEIGVRPNGGGGAFEVLAPRQLLLGVPEALHALSAAAVGDGAVGNAALAAAAISADKIAAGQVVKTLNGIADAVEIVGEGDILVRQARNQVVIAAVPSCFTYTNCYWNLYGNGNIVAGTHFLGTVAGELAPLEFRVNNNRSFLHVFTAATTAPNLIGGFGLNAVSGTGGTISGGGRQGGINQVLADWGTIGGGFTNLIQSGAVGGTVSGGSSNTIVGSYGAIAGGSGNLSSNLSFLGGGLRNRVLADYGVIGGGSSNVISGYTVGQATTPSVHSVVGGGASNLVLGGIGATVGGGQENRIVGTGSRPVPYATIAGGQGNAVLSDAFTSHYASVGGGLSNQVSTAGRATIAGGEGNKIQLEGHFAAIGGGLGQLANGPYATLSGGRSNLISGPGNPEYGTIGGGDQNVIFAESHYATIAGGRRNHIEGFDNHATIGGGVTNAIISADQATIGGGGTNLISDNADFATIGGGRANLISANAVNATISGGSGNLIDPSAPHAVIPGGQLARATNYNQHAFASGNFSSVGDAQSSQYVLRGISQGVVPTELFLDGVSREIVLWPSSVLTFDMLVVGVSGNDSGGYQVRGVIERNGLGINFVGAPVVTTLGEDIAGWSVSVQADAANGSLSVIVSGSLNAAVRWVAHVRTVEVRQ